MPPRARLVVVVAAFARVDPRSKTPFVPAFSILGCWVHGLLVMQETVVHNSSTVVGVFLLPASITFRGMARFSDALRLCILVVGPSVMTWD